VPLYLADTSAWNRAKATPALQERFEELIETGTLALTPPVSLELLDSARGPGDYASLRDELRGLPRLPLDERAVARAEAVQDLLATRSQHRGPKPVDLLVAAVAELHEAVLLHYDRHFDAVVRVTGQPAEWIARRGNLD
jgi:predicted nucleic acid-binding protein